MSTRPIWNGTISFGLVSIPVILFSAEKVERAHFHLLDKKNNARVRYERINDVTGKKVPWENIVKAYEFEKDNFVVVDEEKLEQQEEKQFKTIEIHEFVPNNSIEYPYFDKPYYLVPNKGGEKGYFLLLETLKKMKKLAVAKLVLKTKQHIAVIANYHDYLLLNLLRFQDELRKPEEFSSEIPTSKKKMTSAEIKMAEKLITSMSSKQWNPKKYHNESKEILEHAIHQKIKKGASVSAKEPTHPRRETGKVVDFMELLKKSVEDKKKHERKKQSKKAPTKKTRETRETRDNKKSGKKK